MVRRLTTDLIHVGQGDLSLNDFQERLRSNCSIDSTASLDPSLVDSHGLYLHDVAYDERDFQQYVTYTTVTRTKNKLDPSAPICTGEE
jgi:tRNA U38,U39,U40 pseudouridine synthase TruA